MVFSCRAGPCYRADLAAHARHDGLLFVSGRHDGPVGPPARPLPCHAIHVNPNGVQIPPARRSGERQGVPGGLQQPRARRGVLRGGGGPAARGSAHEGGRRRSSRLAPGGREGDRRGSALRPRRRILRLRERGGGVGSG
jgi:hypothetical protein